MTREKQVKTFVAIAVSRLDLVRFRSINTELVSANFFVLYGAFRQPLQLVRAIRLDKTPWSSRGGRWMLAIRP
jgi:hypothetical protein